MSVTPLDRLFVAGRDPAAVVALRGETELRFGRFAADVAHLAGLARAQGIARAAVFSADPYRFLVGLFGVLQSGATAVVLPDNLPATFAALRDQYQLLFCDAAPSLPAAAQAIEEGHDGAPLPDLIDPTAVVEFFTSGSTGAPKCIRKSLVLLDREVATLDALWGNTIGSGLVAGTVPHRHVFGLAFHLLWPLAGGRVLASHVDELWEDLLARDIAGGVLVTSPAHLTRLGGITPLPPQRRPVRAFTAGAPLSAAQAQQAAAVLGVLPTEIFGSTETGALATRMQHAEGEAWRPLPGITVEADANGCMIVHSPYAPDGAPFFSADRIELMPDGRFHFLGRSDRIAKIEGKRVSLVRVEQALCALPWIDAAAAVVIGAAPERLAAAVVLNEAGRDRLAARGAFRFGRDLRRELAQQLEYASLPKSWRFVAAMPRDAMGKQRDADVRALFAQPQGSLT